MPSRVLTIMFTDIKGFTETTSASSRRELRQLLSKHDNLLVPVLERFGGKLVKTIGDALMVIFESPTNAVLCGMMMQETLRKHNEEHPHDQKLAIRVAINQGEVEVIGEDVYGEPVNIASRIEGITDPGEIFFTEAVYLSMNKNEVPSSEVDEYRLKGLPESVRVYKVIRDTNSEEYQQRILKLETEYSASERSSAQLARVKPNDPKKKFTVGLITVALLVLVAGGLVAGAYAMGAFTQKAVEPDTPSPEDILNSKLAEVDQFISEGKLPNALMLSKQLGTEYPGDERLVSMIQTIIEAEVQQEIDEEQWDNAHELINTRANEHTWLKTDDLKYKVMLAQADRLIEANNHFDSNTAYMNMIKEFPKREELWHHILKKVQQAEYPDRYWIAESAAYRIMKNSEGPLEDFVAQTIHKDIHGKSDRNPGIKETRDTLKKRDPGMMDRLKKDLDHSSSGPRFNAVRLLEEAGEISDEDRIKHYLRLLLDTSSFNHEYFVHSLESLEKATELANWSELIAPLKEQPFKTVSHLNFNSKNERFVRANQFLMTHFPDQFATFLFSRLYNTDFTYVRRNAWRFLHEMERDDEIDKLRFHLISIQVQNPTFPSSSFDEAIDYLKQVKSTDEISEVTPVLEATKVAYQRIATRIEGNLSSSRDVRRLTQSLKNAEDKIQAIDALLSQYAGETATTQPAG